MRRPVALAILAVVLAGCAIHPSDRSESVTDQDVPYALLDPHAPPVVAVPGGTAISICLVADDHLVVGQRELDKTPKLLDILRSLGAVTDQEAARGLGTALSSVELITDVTLAGGTATVHLADGATKNLAPDPLTGTAQIVCTLTNQPGVGLVRFEVSGNAVDVPRADGSLTGAPVTRDDYSTLLQ